MIQSADTFTAAIYPTNTAGPHCQELVNYKLHMYRKKDFILKKKPTVSF